MRFRKETLKNSIQEPKLQLWHLPNNTRCVAGHIPDAPLICLDIWFKAGSVFECPGEEGIAHFLEHMVFKGSENLQGGEFDRRIEALGGSSNAETGFDDVHFHVQIPPNVIEPALDLLLDLVLKPTISQKAFEMEKEVVLEEIAQYEDQPDEIIFQKFLAICWSEHAYGRPILGYKKSLNSCTPNSMKSFHQSRYKPDNCTIAIAGEIPEGIERILDKSLLSTLNQSVENEIKKPNTDLPIFHRDHKSIAIDRLESARIIMAWPIPEAKKQESIMGADIATSILCEGRRSRLVQRLREDLQIVDSIEMDLTVLEQGGLIMLEASCQEKDIYKVENEIHKVLKECVDQSPSIKEINRAYNLVKNSFCFNLETSSQVASQAGAQVLWNRPQSLLNPLKYIKNWDANRLQLEIFKRLQPELSCSLIVKPKKP
tara:strand:+ start:3732 stop:5018 length:1287 start_codon:yes stop_codon:yes gene_type:complete